MTEAYLHPAVDSPELRAMALDWQARVDDYRFSSGSPIYAMRSNATGVTLIGYRPIRDLMRAGA